MWTRLSVKVGIHAKLVSMLIWAPLFIHMFKEWALSLSLKMEAIFLIYCKYTKQKQKTLQVVESQGLTTKCKKMTTPQTVRH